MHWVNHSNNFRFHPSFTRAVGIKMLFSVVTCLLSNQTTEELIPFAQCFALLSSSPTTLSQAHLSNSTVGFNAHDKSCLLCLYAGLVFYRDCKEGFFPKFGSVKIYSTALSTFFPHFSSCFTLKGFPVSSFRDVLMYTNYF